VTQFIVGQTLAFGLKTYDSAGALADVGTGPTATLTKPDGSTDSASVTKTATGTYRADYTADAAGRWTCLWDGSGANSGGLPYPDVADVWPVSGGMVISLADARAALNIATTATAQDDEILLYIRAATAVIEDLSGAAVAGTKVESRSGSGKMALALYERPTAITSVVQDGVTLAATDYALDENGLLWRGSSRGAGVWSDAGVANVVVTYTVASGLDANTILAARELVRHLYAIGQQPWRSPYGGGLEDVAMTTVPAGYAVPARVVQLLEPSMARRMPGMA